MAYIQFQNIGKRFGDNQVLKEINLEVEKGELLTLLGPSGCGKSTLLRCLAGLETVQEGRVFLEGQDITDVEPRLRQIGMVFQQYSLFPNMTVSQNLAFGLKIKKMPAEEIRAEVKKALELVGLSDRADYYPGQLSGGQQQRVALGRAIVTKPKVLLLDEPLSAIDAKLRKALQVQIRSIQKELSITTIFVTHDQDEAMIMSDRICLLNVGKIEQLGTPVDIYTAPATRFAANFIGNYNVYDREIFFRLTGEVRGDAGNADDASIVGDAVAIRPEVIGISRERPAQKDSYIFRAKVQDSHSRGNVLRYSMDANGIPVSADTLFRSFSIYENGAEVWLSVEKRNCLNVREAIA